MRIEPGALMTPADRRIAELIDKWVASIDLHLKYVELSDAAYARVQAWPKHDRPTRWVLEVARQKVLELKAQCETRQAMGDGKYSESLELMAFLANLVGIQHIQRFIPLADPTRTQTASSTSQTVEVVHPRTVAQNQRPSGDDTTREMPRLKAATPAPTAAPAAPARAAVVVPPLAQVKRHEAAKAIVRPTPAQSRPATTKAAPADMRGKIIADAIRLLKWGKSWHELPEAIERIAERPPASEIRKVLRANRADIEAKAAVQD
jgi:hypothetical protein